MKKSFIKYAHKLVGNYRIEEEGIRAQATTHTLADGAHKNHCKEFIDRFRAFYGRKHVLHSESGWVLLPEAFVLVEINHADVRDAEMKKQARKNVNANRIGAKKFRIIVADSFHQRVGLLSSN